jgi:hypothetical protein
LLPDTAGQWPTKPAVLCQTGFGQLASFGIQVTRSLERLLYVYVEQRTFWHSYSFNALRLSKTLGRVIRAVMAASRSRTSLARFGQPAAQTQQVSFNPNWFEWRSSFSEYPFDARADNEDFLVNQKVRSR